MLGKRCPAFGEGGPGQSGDVCQETGIGGRNMRRRCPIKGSTNDSCVVTGTLPVGFVIRWEDIKVRRKQVEDSRQG